jgi:branched-chain amino acid transport system permease protein
MILVLAIGIATGCVYAIVAMGYSLVYRTTGVINFAQGTYVVLGGLGAYWFRSQIHLPYPLAIAAAVALTGAVAAAFWALVIVPLWRRGSEPYVTLLSTVVLAALLGSLIQLLLTNEPQTLPPWIPGFSVELGGTLIEGQYVLVVVGACAMIAGVAWFVRSSTTGRAMRACAASRPTSRLLGINPERIGLLSMTITGLLSGLGGAMITPAQLTSADQGLLYGVFGFVAAVAGGLGSLWGALLGGIVVGILQTLVVRYVSANYETVIVFGVLLVLLTLRPRGLFGVAEFEAGD